MINNELLLTVKNLRIQFQNNHQIVTPVDPVNLNLHRGEIFALVGESGCGKTMTALAINRLLPTHAKLLEGSEIWLQDHPLHHYSESDMQKVRGSKIGMIFQDPALALNPVLTIGEQLTEAVTRDIKGKRSTFIHKSIIHLLEQVRIPDPHHCMKQYPHELSGGMKQRIVIAMALANSPDLLIADEPTTNLDVTTQAQVLELILDLNRERQMGIILITHDFGIVAQMADTVSVMYAGHIIESCSKETFLKYAYHPYTQKLFQALPDNAGNHPLATLPGHVPVLNQRFTLCRFKSRCPVVFKPCEYVAPKFVTVSNGHHVRCHWYDPSIMASLPSSMSINRLLTSEVPILDQAESLMKTEAYFDPDTQFSSDYTPSDEKIMTVSDLKVHFPIRKGIFKRTVGHIKAVDGLSFDLYEGQTLALVGESGCGKTTTAKALLRLIQEGKGKVEFQGKNLLTLSQKKLKKTRQDIQIIFQDPTSAMDPRFKIINVIEEGMKSFNIGSDKKERFDRIAYVMERVGLPQNLLYYYPHQLSGGQKQRVSIARALAVGAQIVICDEPTSALDLSVQAQIINLLRSIQEELDVSYIFITHNIRVVNYLAHEIAVMYLGRIVEKGPAKAVIADPKHPYTQALMSAVPSIHSKNIPISIKGEVPSPSHPPKGCHFSPRCPMVHARCLEAYPLSYPAGEGRSVNCYLYESDRGQVLT